ncbi:MAG: hypothetical protein KKI08_03875, partial [Armatimonadetes bacterium]|nr:hypothetical protein [Armatimonadota bacterium]
MLSARRCLALFAALLLLTCAAPAAPPPVAVFAAGQPRLVLDVPADSALAAELARPLADFERCFRLLTGVSLPTTASQTALFDPSPPGGVRLEATVLAFEDRSAQSGENGTVSLILTPTRHLDRNPLSGPGEKAVWACTWQRGGKGKLQFALIVANQPYQGPGYGPYTFVTLEAPYSLPVRLSLELRHDGGQDVRGGYRLTDGDWVYTDWFDPMKAGADPREPGVSDKNGPQAWAADWPQ